MPEAPDLTFILLTIIVLNVIALSFPLIEFVLSTKSRRKLIDLIDIATLKIDSVAKYGILKSKYMGKLSWFTIMPLASVYIAFFIFEYSKLQTIYEPHYPIPLVTLSSWHYYLIYFFFLALWFFNLKRHEKDRFRQMLPVILLFSLIAMLFFSKFVLNIRSNLDIGEMWNNFIFMLLMADISAVLFLIMCGIICYLLLLLFIFSLYGFLKILSLFLWRITEYPDGYMKAIIVFFPSVLLILVTILIYVFGYF